MRLGQLARHLETSTTEIVQFLRESGIEKNDHPNVKIEEEDEKNVIAHFRPDLIPSEEEIINETQEEEANVSEVEESLPEQAIPTIEIAEDGTEPTPILENEDPELEDEDKIQEPLVEESNAMKQVVSITAAELNTEEDEAPVLTEFDVIKAPKVELPGLKVVGKIDLPEPKAAKEEDEISEDEPTESTHSEEQQPETKVIRHHHKNSRRRLTDEEREARRLKNKREKEKRIARQEARRKQQEERKIKEQKAEHYKQKISKPVPVSKPKKKKPSKAAQTADTRPKPKTVLGKFWRWLNT